MMRNSGRDRNATARALKNAFGGISFRCQRELCNFQCGLQLPAFYRIQADNGSQKSGNPGKVDIEQFFTAGSGLLSGGHHGFGGAYCGNVRKSAGKVVAATASEDGCQ